MTEELEVSGVRQHAGNVQRVVAAGALLVCVQVPGVSGVAIDLKRAAALHVHRSSIVQTTIHGSLRAAEEEYLSVQLVSHSPGNGSLVAGRCEPDEPGIVQRSGDVYRVLAADRKST